LRRKANKSSDSEGSKYHQAYDNGSGLNERVWDESLKKASYGIDKTNNE